MDRKARHFIEGERVYLREVALSDVTEAYRDWMNDPEVVRYSESRFSKHSLDSLRDYMKDKVSNKAYVFFAIINKENEEHIGNIKIGPIDWNHGFGDVGIIIGRKAYWGKGYASEALKLTVEYAFKTLKLHKLTAGCYVNNVGAITAFKNAGFVQEGLSREKRMHEGKRVDEALLSIVNKAIP